MLTLNFRQLRALAAKAPGTLALHEPSTGHSFAMQHWLTTVDDAERTGVWMLTVDQDGNVTEHTTHDRGLIRTEYNDLMRQQREAMLEAEGELSEFIDYCSGA